MTSHGWEQLFREADSLLSRLLDLPQAERAAVIEEQTRERPELQRLVEQLLRDAEGDAPELTRGAALGDLGGSDDTASTAARNARDDRESDARTDMSPGSVEDAGSARDALPSGTTLGPYRIVRELARGGMAIVYEAERVDGALEQRVALKVIRRALASAEMLQRFRQEGQIMALAEHPHVARVFDAGLAPDGRPYLAAEFVDGEPIDRYCDRQRLSVEQRVRLFLDVVEAVAYAHRNLIVHRDIKPSNVMVSSDGVVKLLDFGIAKILDAGTNADRARVDLTATGQRLVTPAYASPEQLRGDTISTASDVYQLGGLLHELLAGRKLFDGASPPMMVARLILETDPIPPSLAVERLARTAPNEALRGAVQRRTSPVRWRRSLQGDLDTIVLKAVAKEPDRRYESASALAEDLRRHLEGQPIHARPATWGYRIGKFLRRNPLAATFGALLVLSLAISATVFALQARALRIARDSANEQAVAARRISDVLIELLALSDPHRTPERNPAAQQLLERADREIEEQLRDQPREQARLKQSVGDVYQNLGMFEQAAASYERALTLLGDSTPGDEEQRAALMSARGAALLGGGDLQGAERLYNQAIDLLDRTLGPQATPSVTTRMGLASVYWTEGRYAEARPLYVAACEERRARLGEEHVDTLSARGNVALTDLRLGHYPEAERELAAIATQRERIHGPDHPLTARAQNNLAYVIELQRRYAEAERLYHRALEIQRSSLGEEHIDTLNTMNNLASVRHAQRDFAGAQRISEQVLAIRVRTLGERHPDVLLARLNLGVLEVSRSDHSAAVQRLTPLLAEFERVLGKEHPETMTLLVQLATAQRHLRQWDAALRNARRARAGREAALGREHQDHREALLLLAEIEAARGERQEAVEWLRQAVAAGVDVHEIKQDTRFASLRADPIFQ